MRQGVRVYGSSLGYQLLTGTLHLPSTDPKVGPEVGCLQDPTGVHSPGYNGDC